VAVAVTSVGVVLVAVSAGFEAGHVPWPAWATAGAGAVLALAASMGRKIIDAISARLAEPFEGLARRSALKRAVFVSALRVGGSRNRVALNIHPAIPLPDHADAGLSVDFPEYVTRDIDADLRAWVRGHVRTGGMVVLAGDAAAGKTRCLYEALCEVVPDWRMPHVDTGAQLNAMVREQVNLSQVVLWLDELQKFFADDALTAGSVRQLIAGRLGPVLIAGTIRDEELEMMQVRPDPADQREIAGRNHAREVIRMLARWSRHSGPSELAVRFHVDSRFTPGEASRAGVAAGRDPRLLTAVRDADGGNVTATLAGAPELIDRWTRDTGDSYGRAIITAAVTARRCGHPEPVPAAVLVSLALAQLAASGMAPAALDWAQSAISWAENSVGGGIAALRRVLTSPGIIDGYKVSDILLQYSYDQACPTVQPLLDDDRTWTLLRESAELPFCTGIGDAASAMGKTATAAEFWQSAAEAGDITAMLRLGWFHADQGRPADARRWFQSAIARGDTSAMLGLASSLGRFGESEESLYWTRQAAELGDVNAMVNLGFELHGIGHVGEAETWYRRAADFDNAIAMTNLGYLLGQRGDTAEAEHWDRRGATLGEPGAMENLARLLRDRGEPDEALKWFRKGADRAMILVDENPSYYSPWPGEAEDLGVSNPILDLAEMLSERGEHAEAELWFRKIAALGDARAAAALADLCRKRNEPGEAAEWHQKAATMAHENLIRNKPSLLTAYGEPAVQRHVRIIQGYADYLAAQGKTQAADAWKLKASAHLTAGSH
jgi:TPR repeat protein